MALQDIPDGLVTDRIAQMGQGANNTVITVCPENLKQFTDLTFSATIFTLYERISAPAPVLW